MNHFNCMKQAFLFAGLLTASIAVFAQTSMRPTVTVPYTALDTGLPRIRLRLNHSVDGNFILDTGANNCLISDTLVTRLGLASHPATNEEGKTITIGSKQAQEVTVSLMELDRIQSSNMPFLLAPPGSFEAIAHNMVDGLIGTNFIKHGAMLIDSIKKELTLWPGGELNADDLKRIGFEDAVALPITTSAEYGHYSIRVRFNDKVEEEIGLDTGGNTTVLPIALVRKLKLKATSKDRPQNTLFGSVTTNETRLQTLTLGTLTLKEVDVQYSASKETPGYFPHLGMDVLSHFRFLLDAPGKKLYLKLIEAASKPDAPDTKH